MAVGTGVGEDVGEGDGVRVGKRVGGRVAVGAASGVAEVQPVESNAIATRKRSLGIMIPSGNELRRV